MFNVHLLKSKLKDPTVFNRVICSPLTKSTQNDLWQLYSSFPAPHLVVANHQTGGRGRGLNRWVSSSNKSIACSFILEQVFDFKKINFHSLIIPVSIVLGIKKHLALDVNIKWPNDIMYKNYKLGGILIESKRGAKKYIFNVGIGINVNENKKDWPLSIAEKAISLKIIFGKTIERELLLANILNELYNIINNYSCSQIISTWEKYCNHINRCVFFKYENKNIVGIFKALNKNGQAIIEKNNEPFYYSGDIRCI